MLDVTRAVIANAASFEGAGVKSAAYVVTTAAAYERAYPSEAGTLASSGVEASDPIGVVKLFGVFPVGMHRGKYAPASVTPRPHDTIVRVIDLTTGRGVASSWMGTGDLGDTTGTGAPGRDARTDRDLRLVGEPTVVDVPLDGS
jgi:hypothetical protein